MSVEQFVEGCADQSIGAKQKALRQFCEAFGMEPEEVQEAIQIWSQMRIDKLTK